MDGRDGAKRSRVPRRDVAREALLARYNGITEHYRGGRERYYSAAYRRTSTEPLGTGCGERSSSHMQKLVPGYETTVELLSGPPKGVRKSTIVPFTPKLIEEVSGAEKYFLGIDFERLRLDPHP